MTERTTGIENEPLEFQEEWLSAYLDGELTSEQRSAVEARLQYDSNVQQMLLDLQKVRSLVAGLPEWPSAFGGLRDFQVPNKLDEAELSEPSAASEVLLKSAKPVKELKPLSENATFDAPQQHEIEEPASPPLKMQTSEEVLGLSQESEDSTGTAQEETEPATHEQADAPTEATSQHEHSDTPKDTSPESRGVADSLAAAYSSNADESVDAGEQSDWDERADEDTAVEGDDSELVVPARESVSYFSEDSKPSILPRMATAASLIAMLGLGYFLWEPIFGPLNLASRTDSSQAEDSLQEKLESSRPESDEKSPAAPGSTITKKSENFSSGETADASVDNRVFGMAGGGQLPFAEPQANMSPLEQPQLAQPSASAAASNSQMDKTALPSNGGVPPAMDSPKVQSRRMQSGLGGRGGRPREQSLGGGGGAGLPPAGMRSASVESAPASPGSAAPSMMKMENGFHLSESKEEATERAGPVMEMAPFENLPDRQLSEADSPENVPRLGGGLPTPPAKEGRAARGDQTTIAGLDLGILPQLHRQTKLVLGRYEVVSDGSWSLDQMKQGLLRLNNRRSQTGAPEAAIGKFEGTTELLLEQILEDASHQKLSSSLANRGRQQPVGEAAGSNFPEAITPSMDPAEKRVAPSKSILLFTHRAAAEKLLQSKSVSKATGQYLWVRSPNEQANPGDKVLLLLNPK